MTHKWFKYNLVSLKSTFYWIKNITCPNKQIFWHHTTNIACIFFKSLKSLFRLSLTIILTTHLSNLTNSSSLQSGKNSISHYNNVTGKSVFLHNSKWPSHTIRVSRFSPVRTGPMRLINRNLINFVKISIFLKYREVKNFTLATRDNRDICQSIFLFLATIPYISPAIYLSWRLTHIKWYSIFVAILYH